MEKQWDVVVVGGVNYDYLVRGATLPEPGDTVQGQEFQEAPGGKGANQAVAAARLGAKVALVARIGQDARGDRILDRLTEEGVDTTYVLRDDAAQTGVALVHVTEAGEKQILVAPGANTKLTPADVAQAGPAIQAAHVLLTQLEVPLASVEMAIRQAHTAGVRIILDPAPPQELPADWLPMLDLVKPNAGEAESLTGVQVQGRDSARDAAYHLLEWGVKAVAIQGGARGNLLVWQEDEQWLPQIEVASVDATGAGDALAAALAVALAEGRPMTEAGPFANAAAALTTTKLGAQAALPRRDAVLDLIAQSRDT
ncbi:MAG: ribokinase [Caldilineaceae bacterium]